MPTTRGGKGARPYVLGVDGCPAGWVAVSLNLSGGATTAHFFQDIRSLLDGLGRRAEAILIDMPIGLPDMGRRACELAARRLIGPRRSSVFAAPRRPMLSFETYAEANAWGKSLGTDGGGGLSKQAWMLRPKIIEIDEAVSPELQAVIGEGHPEVAFTRLAGRPCAHSKRTSEGKAERSAILQDSGVPGILGLVECLRRELPRQSQFSDDDALDAAALALSAAARTRGVALRLSDDARDVRGLVMEIWG